MRSNGIMIRGLDIKKVLVNVIVVPDSELAILRVDTLHISRINLRVSLVHPFRQCFRLLMEVCLVLVITLVRVAVII